MHEEKQAFSARSSDSCAIPPRSHSLPRQNTIFVENDAYGGKTIGFLGGYVLLINNITGPGLAILPLAFQASGWAMTCILTIIFGLLSMVCCKMLIEAMTYIPGNDRFQGRVEFTYLAKRFLSKRSFYLVFFLFLLSLVTTNISSIVESGQVLDRAMLAMGNACAMEVFPDFKFYCITNREDADSSDSVFGERWVISAGYLVILIISIPLGYLNLDDNIIVQFISFLGLATILMIWYIFFASEGFHPGLCPAIGHSSIAFGYVFFNFSFVITIPSWINEKRPEVPINSSIHQTTTIGIGLFLLTGFLGALASKYEDGVDLLAVLTDTHVTHYARIATYTFPLFALVTSIPVFSIIMRYNLLENKVCSTAMANFWSVLMPWLLALFVYGGDSINYILNWAGILTVGPLNFLVPAWVYIIATQQSCATVPESGEIEAKYAKLSTVFEEPEEGTLNPEISYTEDNSLCGGKEELVENPERILSGDLESRLVVSELGGTIQDRGLNILSDGPFFQLFFLVRFFLGTILTLSQPSESQKQNS